MYKKIIQKIKNYFLKIIYIKIKIINFINMIKLEINNIYWPSFNETIKITCSIFIISILLSLILWIIDKFLFIIITFILNLRF
ncbi:preprotein translocase subunit SecE [Buchnera aphidicola]|uniref:Preprotein translocase subunit SecE n=1 Tax=Buchnera aphidicola (Therioaphis trifolii) TaxID=1241884 RepID=A0A4D6YPC4_9GAMM|nr:preprotein translocase subunit SecE [Buchnera aphidicola]QCI27045.1 preprotein translocase subunit SecE [Buchnera aphidicola (Therioaphis trifolii)]